MIRGSRPPWVGTEQFFGLWVDLIEDDSRADLISLDVFDLMSQIFIRLRDWCAGVA